MPKRISIHSGTITDGPFKLGPTYHLDNKRLEDNFSDSDEVRRILMEQPEPGGLMSKVKFEFEYSTTRNIRYGTRCSRVLLIRLRDNRRDTVTRARLMRLSADVDMASEFLGWLGHAAWAKRDFDPNAWPDYQMICGEEMKESACRVFDPAQVIATNLFDEVMGGRWAVMAKLDQVRWWESRSAVLMEESEGCGLVKFGRMGRGSSDCPIAWVTLPAAVCPECRGTGVAGFISGQRCTVCYGG